MRSYPLLTHSLNSLIRAQVTSIVTGNYDDFGQFDHLFEEKVEEVESVAPEEKVEVEGKKEPEIVLSPEEEERIRLDTDKRAKERAAQIITKYRELYLLDSDGKKMWDSKYVDPRTTNTFAIERNFRYIYDHGELRLSFVTPTSKNTKIRLLTHSYFHALIFIHSLNYLFAEELYSVKLCSMT